MLIIKDTTTKTIKDTTTIGIDQKRVVDIGFTIDVIKKIRNSIPDIIRKIFMLKKIKWIF